MPDCSPEIHLRKYSGRYNALRMHHGEDDPVTVAAKRDLDVARLERAARELVADWPDLSQEQRDRLALVLRG